MDNQIAWLDLPIWFWLGVALLFCSLVFLRIYLATRSTGDKPQKKPDQAQANKPKKKFKLKPWMIYAVIAVAVVTASGLAYRFEQTEVAAGILAAALLIALLIYYLRRKRATAKPSSATPMPVWQKAALAFAIILGAYKLLGWLDQPAKHTMESLLSSGKVSTASVSYTVVLDARNPKWSKFDVDIPDSSVVTFNAFGEVNCDPEVGPTGPEGAPWTPGHLKRQAHLDQFLVDNIRMFSLVGRVGKMTFSIGRWLTQEFIQGGLLQLTLNERWQSKCFTDNTGSLTVLITVEPLHRHSVVSALQFQEDADYYWDANHNYEPDSVDLNFLLDALQDPSVFPDEMLWYGDVNGDETFNLVDLMYFQRFMNGLGPPPVKAMWLEPAR